MRVGEVTLSGRKEKEVQARIKELKNMQRECEECLKVLKRICESVDSTDDYQEVLDNLFEEINELLENDRIELCMMRGE